MASIVYPPEIAFVAPLVQETVRVSFKVKFSQQELAGKPPAGWKLIYPGLLPFVKIGYRAKVVLNVIRVGIQPFVKGSPPPPVPDPVKLGARFIAIPKPHSGSITSRSVQFGYQLGSNEPFTYDHLHAVVYLYRVVALLPGYFNLPLDSETSGHLLLTVADLASPQSTGVIIPYPWDASPQ